MIRRPLPRLLLAAAALFATTACEEESITLDSGDPSALEVRVYVDANGNGEYDAGDEAIASATVQATGPVDMTATTGADGLAVFEGLTPGSYTLSLAADTPTGAVLASATTPVVVADFRGGTLEAEFRYAFEPGSISGRLYRDDNDNDQFDADADLPGAGISVTAVRASDDAEFTTTTGGDGSYELTGLRPGTYTVTFGLPEDADLEGGESFTVQVGSATAATLNAVFTGDLVVDIADARNAPLDQSVTVEGTVIWQKGWDSRSYFIQDETAGINVFHFGAPDYDLGDRVRITGQRGEFGGEIQIDNISSYEIIGSEGTPVPVAATAADIASGELRGELVAVDGTVTDVTVISFGNQIVTLEDSEGGEVTIYVDSRTGVEADAWEEGQYFGVIGVVDSDDELNPRFPDDVQLGGIVIDIADARDAATGSTLAIQGVITFVAPDGRNLFVQDASGGINVFDFDLGDFEPMGGFSRGQMVRLSGEIGAYNSEIQFTGLTSVTVVGDGLVPSPVGVTGSELGDHPGELVVATGTVTEVDDFGDLVVTLEDASGTEFAAFVAEEIGLTAGDFPVGSTFRVTGPVGVFFSPQIEVRDAGDVVAVDPGDPTSIAEARSMVGETVTIQGVVSRKETWSGAEEGWVQDGTGGIFVEGELGPVAAGDEVEITGEISEAFGNEIHIVPTTVTVVGTPGTPTPIVVSGAGVNAFFHQALLVELTGTVLSVEEVNSFGTQEVVLLTADGSEVQVYVDNRTGLAASDWTEGETVTVVAPVGRFFENAQLEVMQDTDVTFGS